MNTSDKRLELKECPECKGAVMQHFDTCPHCGACQSKNCIEKEKTLREKALTINQGHAKIKKDESINPYGNFGRTPSGT